jgi:hypothetical protein
MKVRISSDAAGAISLTPVVVRDLTLAELLDYVVEVCGKDLSRIHNVLGRGTLVNGASRFRWDRFDLPPSELTSLLERYPDPDPARAFSGDRCVLAILRGGSHHIPLSREAAAKRRLFRRQTFWDHLLSLGPAASYLEYSYRNKADVYRTHISPAVQERLQRASGLLSYSTLSHQLQSISIESVDLYVAR